MKPESRAPNVRISRHAYDLLRKLSEEQDESMQAILDRALERYRRETFLRGANADFEALKRDPKAWKQELRGRQIWEQTLPDGLDPE